MKTIKQSVGIGFAACLALSAVGDTAVGFREIGGVNAGSGEEQSLTGKLTLSPEARFYKTGAGTVKVQSSGLDSPAPYSMDVLGGKLVLEGAAATPESPSAPDVAQQAALWLDASTLTEGDSVSTWYDVRGGSGRYSAVAKWLNAGANDGIAPVVAVTNGAKGVYFGGQSGKYMGIKVGTSNVKIEKVHHFFVVHGVYETYGSLLGYTSDSRGNGLLTTTASTGGTMACDNAFYLVSSRGDLDWKNFQGRFFLDGEFFDPRRTMVRLGNTLFEGDMQAQPETFNALYYNYFETYNKDTAAPGGDYMFEVMIFTNRLTEVARLDVEHYLMNKWSLPMTVVQLASNGKKGATHRSRGTGLVNVATNAQVEVTVGENETSAPFQFGGTGSVVKKGAGTMVIGGGAVRPFAGSFTLEEGSLLVRGGTMPPVAIGAGEVWDASNWPATRAAATPENDATTGVRVVRTVSADGKTRKTGEGELQVAEIGSGVGRIAVEKGVLHLAAKETAPGSVDDGISADEVEIPNYSFEMPFVWKDQNGRSYNWSSCNGWYNDRHDTTVQMMTSSCANYNAWSAGKYDIPDGTNALMIVLSGYGYTKVTVPRAGTYELSLFAASRYGSPRGGTSDNFNRRSNIEVMFNNRCVGHLQVNQGAYTRYRYRFTVSSDEVGKSVALGFWSRNAILDNCTIIDDVHLKPVAETERTDVVKVPGGDFEESYQYDADGNKLSILMSAFCRLITGPDWTLSLTSGATTQNPTNGYVAICTPGTPTMYAPSYTDHFTTLFPQADGVTGSGVLAFIGNCGVATTKKSFKLPKGTWILRGDIYWSPLNVKIGLGAEISCGSEAKVEVTLTRNSTDTSLGSVTTSIRKSERCYWPTEITVTEDAGDDITLAIRQTVAGGSCTIDNLEFVPVAAGDDTKNLFRHGDFELTPALFSKFTYATGETYSSLTGRFKYRTNSWAFGLDVVNGDYCVRLHNDVGIQQEVTFPAAGLYRLIVPAHTRSDGGNQEHKELRASVVLSDDTEMEIFRQPIPLTQTFQEISYLFRIPAAGAYLVRICGIPISGGAGSGGIDRANRTTLIDGVKIFKVEETVSPAVPVVSRDAAIDVTSGAKLALDYDGTVTVRSLHFGGRKVYGTVDAQTEPDYVTGMGSIEVKPIGSMFLVR